LQVVDVPLHQADAVASGPTLADPSTVDDCRELLERYRLLETFPAAVRRFFSRPDLPETPGDKAALKHRGDKAALKHRGDKAALNQRGDKAALNERAEQAEAVRKAGLKRASFAIAGNGPSGVTDWLVTLLSNDDLLRAARQKAAALGYEVVIDNHCDDWPYDQAAAYLVDRLIELRRLHPGRKLCLLSGGEVTVRLSFNEVDRKPGAGGRNQHFALACALLLHERLPDKSVVCLSAGSDGADGNSPAAGALADPSTITRAHALGLDARAALAAFDAYPLFTTLGNNLLTGPTGNNLRDLRVLLWE
jgi:glycerate 2-kinase